MLVTKWKTYRKKTLTKVSVYVAILICLLIGASSALNIYLRVKDYESILVKNYLASNSLSNTLRYAANKLDQVVMVYKNESSIKRGDTVKNLEIKDSWQLSNLYNNFIAEKNLEDTNESKEIFYKEKKIEIDDIKNQIINADLSTYQQIIKDLNNETGLVYYATDGTIVTSNAKDKDKTYYKTKKAYIIKDESGVTMEPQSIYGSYDIPLAASFESRLGPVSNIYVAITDEGLIERQKRWEQDRQILTNNLFIIALSLILIFVFLIYLTSVAGRTEEDDEVHLLPLDRLYTDISALAILGALYFASSQFYNVLNIRYSSENIMRVAMLTSLASVSTVVLWLILSLIRHLKNKTLIEHSVLFLVIKKALEKVNSAIESGPLMAKTILAALAIIAMSSYSQKQPLLLIAAVIISVYLINKNIKYFQTIQKALEMVKKGDYNYKINLPGNGELKRISDDINEITGGLKLAVENEVKSEKLKTELITNVSHDIKTPLTSIISYVDLLKREGLNSPNAAKYLDVLDRKSNRLKTLTEDLFEVTRATSGSIEPNFEMVNVNALISQILGELDEKIQDSNLVFKTSYWEEKIYANADGRLLSRVMENLLSNIFKYAQKNSRVYIDTKISDEKVIISFKNVSAYELNIPINELMERFKRGDESRSSEGHGLGLAIAKSLTEIQKGLLTISIDGDLFKAQITLEKYVS